MEPYKPIQFKCGVIMKNPFMLAPLTNQQSNEDGTLSDQEFHWLTLRAKGNFGMVTTCATHVNKNGKGFPGQLGIFSDNHIVGHRKLVQAIQSKCSLAVAQLHHAGMRSPEELIDTSPLCPSPNKKYNAHAASIEEVIQLKKDFVSAALRAKEAGYDGVEIHGAHGYILSQFLSSEINHRADSYGGSLENRARLLFEIVEEIRSSCGNTFLIGVRLSPERFGMDLSEVTIIAQQLIDTGQIDFLDISLWDSFKMPENEKYQDKTLLEHFTELNKREVKLTVAGNITSTAQVHELLSKGVDFVCIGKSGILHHDFPVRVMNDSNFKTIDTPVSEEYLLNQGLSPVFVDYMRRWPNFVETNQE